MTRQEEILLSAFQLIAEEGPAAPGVAAAMVDLVQDPEAKETWMGIFRASMALLVPTDPSRAS